MQKKKKKMAYAAEMKWEKFSAYKTLGMGDILREMRLHVPAAEGLGHLRRLPKSLRRQAP